MTPAAGEVSVEEVGEVTPELVEALGRLLPQLSRSAPPLTEAALTQIVSSPATVLLVARAQEKVGAQEKEGGEPIVGSLTLALFTIPTGLRAWIEDVVVDEAWRGRGVGRALTRDALGRAAAAGARTVELTSRPSREAANRLYRGLGFVERETNVYRYDLT